MKNKFLLIFLMLSFHLFGQAPGYMGKKLLIGLNGSYAPDYAGLILGDIKTANSNGKQVSFLSNPLRYGISIKYAIKENDLISFSFYTQKASYIENYSKYNSNSGNLEGIGYVTSDFKTFQVGVSKSEAAAPIGRFSSSNIIFVIADVNYTDINGKMVNAGKIADFGYNYETGIRHVFFDRLVLESEIEMNVYINGIISFLSFKAYQDSDLNAYVRHRAIANNYLNNIIVLKLGCYYLL